MSVLAYLWVGLGGALGSMARLGLGLAVARLSGEAFPWGTLIINVLGSFVIGFFGTLTLDGGPLPASTELRLFVMVGICGGFTTFSSFSLQTLALMREEAWWPAAAYAAASVVLCLAAVAVGHWLAVRIGLVYAPPTPAR